MKKLIIGLLIILVYIQGVQIDILRDEQHNIYDVLNSIILEYENSEEKDGCFTEQDINKIISEDQ